MMRSAAALLLLTVVAVACSTTPQARFYALGLATPVTNGVLSGVSLALGPIDLPEYLDRPQIVTRAGGNRLTVDEFNRWGGPLEEEIGRVLASYLSSRLGVQHVYSYPSRVVAQTDYRIALDIRSFDGQLGGEVSLDAAWSLIDDRSGRVLQTQQVVYHSRATTADYDGYASALGTTLAQLGDDLAGALSQVAGSDR